MKHCSAGLLSLLLLAGGAMINRSQGQVVYDAGPSGNVRYVGAGEFGDEINAVIPLREWLMGSVPGSRGAFEFIYFAGQLTPDPAKQLVLRFYELNGPVWHIHGPGGEFPRGLGGIDCPTPGTCLFSSELVPLPLRPGFNRVTLRPGAEAAGEGPRILQESTAPPGEVPFDRRPPPQDMTGVEAVDSHRYGSPGPPGSSTVVWTVSFSGLQPGENAGLLLAADLPVVGSSFDDFWARQPDASWHLRTLDDWRVPGNFWCRLTYDGPVPVTLRPQTQMVNAGARVMFIAETHGWPVSLSHQWYKDGVELPAATNAVLTLTNAQDADTGMFQVKVADASSFTLSKPVFLAVTEPSRVDFEDLSPSAVYQAGDVLNLSGVRLRFHEFESAEGCAVTNGNAAVQVSGVGVGSGQELALRGVSVAFEYGRTLPGLALRYNRRGGGLNLRINGGFLKPPDFASLAGKIVDTVRVALLPNDAPNNPGLLVFQGALHSLALGGEDLVIDDVCPLSGLSLKLEYREAWSAPKITLFGAPGATHELQFRASLQASETWQFLATLVPTNGPAAEFLDTTTPLTGQRFYRAVRQSSPHPPATPR